MSDDRRMDRLDEKSGPPAGLIGGGILAALVVIFIFQNTESAPVKFLMFDGEAKMWVVIVISAARLLVPPASSTRRGLTPTASSITSRVRPLRADSSSPGGGRHNDRVRVESSDHISVAVHELGGRGTPLLLSHATGFHGYCYLPVADALADEFDSFALDYRGHGSTARPEDWQVDWNRYGDDALAVAEQIAPDGGLVGFGHSMGGAALLMAAHRNPGLFDLIVAFEPIVFPGDPTAVGAPPSGLVEGARRRRPSFESFEAAVANYASKPPMSVFDPDVLRLYVAHGFAPAPEGVRLKCDPEHEARTFETGATHRTFDVLPEIDTRVVVIASGDAQGPALVAPLVAERLPNAELVELPEANHFFPFIDPAATAKLISAAV